MPEWEDDDNDEGADGSTGVAIETQKKVKKPPLHKVLLHNDDFTPMDFVVFVLSSIFHKQAADAERIMLAVHRQGVGIAGEYTYEIAESKVARVAELAKEWEYPFMCTIEE